MTLTQAETCSLWRRALLGLDIFKSKAERDSQVDFQSLTCGWHLEADMPQRLQGDETL